MDINVYLIFFLKLPNLYYRKWQDDKRCLIFTKVSYFKIIFNKNKLDVYLYFYSMASYPK